jgi:hypothetical protein
MAQQLTAMQQGLEIHKWLHDGYPLRRDSKVIGLNEWDSKEFELIEPKLTGLDSI